MQNEEVLCERARAIYREALETCGIERALAHKLHVVGDKTALVYGAESVALAGVRHIRIVAAGKAAAPMLRGMLRQLAVLTGLDVQGVLIAPECPKDLPPRFAFFAGGHPLPNEASFAGARAVLSMLRDAATMEGVLCLYLISGGASAMMELPLDAAISLDDTVELYRALVPSGATIAEINCIRKHFSAVKGGRLALAAGDAPGLTLLVSDVPPERLDSLASGPTLPDPTTVEECLGLLSRYAIERGLPLAIQRFFHSSAIEETPKPGSMQARAWKLLDSDDLAAAAEAYARGLGYTVVIDNTCDDWSYLEAAPYLLERLRQLRTRHRRVCLISAGEVTVAVPDVPSARAGRGGRNAHFALLVATLLMREEGAVAVLSAGSDGIDGNSHAAGAVVHTGLLKGPEDVAAARKALAEFDSATFLGLRNALIVTGLTRNNLRDLRVLLAM